MQIKDEKEKFGGKGIKRRSETTARSRRNGGEQMYSGSVRERKVWELEDIKLHKREEQDTFIVPLYFS